MVDETILFFILLFLAVLLVVARAAGRGLTPLPGPRPDPAAALDARAEAAFTAASALRRPRGFDRDIWAEIMRARREGADHAPGSPEHVFARVRWRRALDEQRARAGLPASTRPDDWLTTYAGGRVGLPRAKWERPREVTPPPMIALAGRNRARGGERGAERLSLAEAVLRAAKGLPELGGRSPRLLGAEPHTGYIAEDWPWGAPYLHLLAREPAGGVEADLMLSYGIKGCVYGFAAVIIETRRDRTGRPADRRTAVISSREQALGAAGYAVLAFDPGDLAANLPDCAQACLTPVRALLETARP